MASRISRAFACKSEATRPGQGDTYPQVWELRRRIAEIVAKAVGKRGKIRSN
jgi:hypothetical protein